MINSALGTGRGGRPTVLATLAPKTRDPLYSYFAEFALVGRMLSGFNDS
jgi:hypothetical protein